MAWNDMGVMLTGRLGRPKPRAKMLSPYHDPGSDHVVGEQFLIDVSR